MLYNKNSRKRIKDAVRLIFVISFIILSIRAVYAADTEIINIDFEDISFEEFAAKDNVELFTGIEGDVLSIDETDGNKVFKLQRQADMVDNSSVPLGFTYKLPEVIDSGKVKVSFKIKAKGVYRSRWRDLGSVITSDNARNLFLFTHSSWAWAQSTGSAYWNSNISTADVWYEVRYELDLDTNAVVIGAGVAGGTITTKDKTSSGGDFAALRFTVGKQNNSWTASNSGDLCYFIDDIKISQEKINVLNASVSDGAEQVPIENPVVITFDEEIDEKSITTDNFILVSDENINIAKVQKINDKTVEIEPENGFDYISEYFLTVKKTVLSKSGSNMLKDYKLHFKTLSVIDCNIKNDASYTEGFLPKLNKAEDIDYMAQISVNEREYEQYDFTKPLNEKGDYKLKITAEDKNGKKQTEEYSFIIVGAVAPVIEGEVVVSGEPIIGATLIAEYTFKDLNGDEQDLEKTVHKWWRIYKNGFVEEIEGEVKKEYTLTENDEDCYIKFTVIPYSKEEPCEGEKAESALFVGPMNPVAKNIKPVGSIAEGKEIGVTYDYSDENEDAELKEETLIKWYSSLSRDGEFKKIGEGEKYILKENDNNCFLKIGVIPKNSGSGKQETEYFSEVFEGAFVPEAKKVKIIGTLKAGNVVGVDYAFFDVNDDEEGESIIEWYINNTLVSRDTSYTVSSADSGKKIYVSVTPVSKASPYIGEAVKSDVLTIQSSKSESYQSGGKGGGGSVVTKPADTQNNNQYALENTDIIKQNKPQFQDISGHWAESEIKLMAERGILNGKSEGFFAPEDAVTRAELAAIIARSFKLSGQNSNFSDVSDSDWFKTYVDAVFESGYMNGSNGRFRPYDFLTRQEIAVVLQNISKKTEIAKTREEKLFKDHDKIAVWAVDAVGFATSAGLLKGVDDENFYPLGVVTRAQAAVILSRLLR